MDSSSDGSFAWTDASNDTTDSGTMLNNKMNKHHSEDESISEKVYKKKLQEELFAQSNGAVAKEKQPKPKERKRKVHEEQSQSEHDSPKKKKIKREPESDMDVSATTYKTNGHHSDDHDSYDQSYLDLKVKAEQQNASPSKSKKYLSDSISNSQLLEDSSVTTNIKTKRISKRHSYEEPGFEDDKLNQLVQEETESYERKVKKKKKKTNKRKDSVTSDEARHRESYVEEEGNQTLGQGVDGADSYVSSQVETFVHKKVKNNKNLSQSSMEDPGDCKENANGLKQQLEYGNKSVSFDILDESANQTPRISERIQFEDDDSSDHEIDLIPNGKTLIKSSKLKAFLKNNLNLKPLISKINNESSLTVNDEIWIIRCPKDVDIDAFHNKDFTLEGKCKLKINGQTYEGIVDNESANMSVLALEQSKFVIKSLPVNGHLNLRKRIPKSHIRDEVMADNQTNFIPLPETKCRHPLFGSNYRKAIKLSNSVAARLAPPPPAPAPPPRAPAPPAREDAERPSHSKKKKKKRKHLDSEETVPKKKKRIKHDLESAEAWESEQAIEDNLFNF